MNIISTKHTGDTVHSFDGGDIINCQECGFKHVMPLPSAEDLRQFYEAEFYQTEKSTYLAASAEDIEWKSVEFSRRYEIAEKHLGAKSGKRVLDIGSGPGEFLELGISRGWEVLGVEPSPVAAAYARGKGIEIITGFFDEKLAATLGVFDFVHMSEVLEHIPNPQALLKSAYSLLKPGGILCISVPNDFSPVQQVLVESEKYTPWWIVPDHHLNYFNFDTLGATISAVGYELLEKTTNFPMELFLLMGQNYTEDGDLGRKLHGWRKIFDLTLAKGNPKLLNRFYEVLARAEMGRLAVQFARKP